MSRRITPHLRGVCVRTTSEVRAAVALAALDAHADVVGPGGPRTVPILPRKALSGCGRIEMMM